MKGIHVTYMLKYLYTKKFSFSKKKMNEKEVIGNLQKGQYKSH